MEYDNINISDVEVVIDSLCLNTCKEIMKNLI